jgi:3-oxoacyl-[acyl-carrier protein] reductase
MTKESRVLEGAVTLVTGSSRGIGAAIAREFARQGASVAVHGRDRSAVEQVSSEIRESGGMVVAVTADVTRFDEIERMRNEIEETLGPLTHVVANAGGSLTRPGVSLEELSEEGWRASIDANLTATFLTLKSALPGMKSRRRGNIITISSAAARRPTARSPLPYAAAKAGIQLLTQHLALSVGEFGIRVNCIAPESIMTEKNAVQIPPEQIDKMIADHPIRRLGTPEDVADAALFLAAEQSGWISGIVLDVAGGSVLA